MLKNKLAAVLLTAIVAGQLGATALADDGAAEKGPMTTDHPVTWGLVSFPFRVTSGALGMGVGALSGMATGIVDTEKKFAENTYGKAGENPLMAPVGLVGSVVAVPVGIITGFPPAAVKGAETGYKWWDRF